MCAPAASKVTGWQGWSDLPAPEVPATLGPASSPGPSTDRGRRPQHALRADHDLAARLLP
jgi:hypothetical protein